MAGAKVTIQNEAVTDIMETGATDEAGEYLSAELPAGRYTYRITSADHQEAAGRFWIKPGVTTTREEFLEYNLVTVEWGVREIALEDRYEIVLQPTYTTNVPAAVVVAEPASATLPKMQAGDVYQGEFNLVNYGLIRADDLTWYLPVTDQYAVELLHGIPDSLEAGARMTAPYRVTRLQGNTDDGDASGGGTASCWSLICAFLDYVYECANGHRSTRDITYCLNVWTCGPDDDGDDGGDDDDDDAVDPGAWQRGSGSDAQYIIFSGGKKVGTGGPSGAGSGSPVSPPTLLDGTENDCYPKTQGRECANSVACQECGQKETCQHVCVPTSSSVNTLTRDYRAEGPGLSVALPNGTLRVAPEYRQGAWFFGPDRSAWDGRPAEAGSLQFHRYGDPEKGCVITAIIKDGDIPYSLPPENFALRKEYDHEGHLLSERYEYVGDRIYLHENAYTLVPRGSGYRWQETSGNWQDYDADGRLTAFGSRRGTLARMLVDEEGILRGYTDAQGAQVLWVDYNAEGRIAALRDADGRQVTYRYDAEGRLAAATDAEGEETTYTYTGPLTETGQPRLTVISTSGGRDVYLIYSTGGSVVAVLDETGAGYDFNYAYDDRKKEYYAMILSPSGTVKEVWYDEQGDTKRVDIDGETVQTITKDDEHNALILTDAAGQETRKEYDEWDNLVKVIFPDGTESAYEYDQPFQQLVRKHERGVISEYAYNSDGALTRMVEAKDTDAERITEYTYNAAGNRIKMQLTENAGSAMEVMMEESYDDNGNQIRLVEAAGSDWEKITEYIYTEGKLTTIVSYPEDDIPVTTQMEYDSQGRLNKKITLAGETTYTYTADGDLETVQTNQGTWQYIYTNRQLTSLRDPFEQVVELIYTPDGEIDTIKVNEKIVESYTYENNLLTQRIDAAGNVYQYNYNQDDQLVRQIDPENREISYEYDQEGRLIKTIDGNGNAIIQVYGVSVTGEPEEPCTSCSGSILDIEETEDLSFERLQKIIYPTFTKEFYYDRGGNIQEETYVSSNGETYSVSFTYDQFGRVQTRTDPKGKTITYNYDLLGRRTAVEDASGQMIFEYSNRGKLIALKDAKNQQTRFKYDTPGRLEQEIRPMNQTFTAEYDQKGRLWKSIDAKNQMTEYGYDDINGRLQHIMHADGKTITLNYDAEGNLAGYNDGITSATYEYDDMGRKLKEIVDYGPFTKEFSYTYYKNGLKKTFTDPNGVTNEYAYGKNNELREVRIPGLGAITISEYTWLWPKRVIFPGGSQQEYTYDSFMHIQSLNVTDPGGNPLMNYTYTHDSTGNIVTKDTEHGTYTYGYDALSRLTNVDNPIQKDETYSYDAVGNRVTASEITGTWSYNANNELLGYGNIEYEYDENGNLTHTRINGDVVFTYIYNAANLLVHVEDITGTILVDYYYDPFGRRLWKDVNGVRTYFCYSNEGLIGEYDANGNELQAYGYKPNGIWTSDPLFLRQNGSYYFYHNDHLGTPQILTAANGSVVWSAQYSAFGKTEVQQVETLTSNLRFAGQYYDAETGFHYNWFRYYDPKIGRYIQADPLNLLSGDANLYRYVWSNPVKWIDPFGLLDPSVVQEVMTDEAFVEYAEQIANGGGTLTALSFTLSAPVSTLLVSGTTGVATVGGGVLAAFGLGYGLGTLANELVIEPYIAEPLFDLLWPKESSIESPLPTPLPAPNPTIPKDSNKNKDKCPFDDFGRQCKREELRQVTVHAIFSLTDEDETGHASLKIRKLSGQWSTVGWWPKETIQIADLFVPTDGTLKNDSGYVKQYSPKDLFYDACPLTMEILAKSAKPPLDGKFNLFNSNARNCTGWVCQVLRAAEVNPQTPWTPKLYMPSSVKLNPINPCETPRIKPIHLTPSGVGADLITLTQRQVKILRKRYPYIQIPPEYLPVF